MIYPKKISSKKIDVFLKIFSAVIVLISAILVLINLLTTPNIYWSELCIFGFIYIYLTVRYSITRTRNIANHVMIQTIFLAMLVYSIDYLIGYSGWSMNIALPILIIIANIAMFIITIVNYKDYGKYAISQLIIVLLSLLPIYFIYKEYIEANVLNNIAIIISIVNFLISLILCYRDLKEDVISRFKL